MEEGARDDVRQKTNKENNDTNLVIFIKKLWSVKHKFCFDIKMDFFHLGDKECTFIYVELVRKHCGESVVSESC